MSRGLSKAIALAVLRTRLVSSCPQWVTRDVRVELTGVQPAFEKWEKNGDGTFNLVFGYMNDNWQQELNVPIGRRTSQSGGPGGSKVSKPAFCHAAIASSSV